MSFNLGVPLQAKEIPLSTNNCFPNVKHNTKQAHILGYQFTQLHASLPLVIYGTNTVNILSKYLPDKYKRMIQRDCHYLLIYSVE